MIPSRHAERPLLSLPSIRDVLPDQFHGGRSPHPPASQIVSPPSSNGSPNVPRQPSLRGPPDGSRDRDRSAHLHTTPPTGRHGRSYPPDEAARGSCQFSYTYPPPEPGAAVTPTGFTYPGYHPRSSSLSTPSTHTSANQRILPGFSPATYARLPVSYSGSPATARRDQTLGEQRPDYGPHSGRPLTPPSPTLSMSDSETSDTLSQTQSSSPTLRNEGTTSRSHGSGDGKRHSCPHCYKRFNRPSSLAIHINTHTGVKPFGCPYPHCGKVFNVNSNMRRHYKNHFAGSAPISPYSSSSLPLEPAGSDLQIIRYHEHSGDPDVRYPREGAEIPNDLRDGRRRALSWEMYRSGGLRGSSSSGGSPREPHYSPRLHTFGR